jgi:hypothetical protein
MANKPRSKHITSGTIDAFTPALSARLDFPVALLSPLVVVGVASAVTTLVKVEVGLVLAVGDIISVEKTTDVSADEVAVLLALGNWAVVEVMAIVEIDDDEQQEEEEEDERVMEVLLVSSAIVGFWEDGEVGVKLELEPSVTVTTVTVTVEAFSMPEAVEKLEMGVEDRLAGMTVALSVRVQVVVASAELDKSLEGGTTSCATTCWKVKTLTRAIWTTNRKCMMRVFVEEGVVQMELES